MENKEWSSGKGETIGNNSEQNIDNDKTIKAKLKTNINIGYCNAHSAKNKTNTISDFISDNNLVDVLAITETW